MRHLLAALLLSTATLACSKAPDPAAAAGSADPTAIPSTGGAALAPSPSQSSGTTASAPAPAAAAAAPAAAEPTPDLVEAAPGVQVVADYDTPVFFNSGMYWRFNDGGWYSSSVYTGGWEYKASPPQVIVSIDRPERFVHFKPSGYVVRSRPAPQREWHPAPVVRAEVHADVHAPEVRGEVRVEPPRAEVHVEPRAEVHVEPHPVVVKTVVKPVVREHRD